MSVASAPGKVHLIGEHAVVYGEPAIIAAVGLRTTVEAKKSEKCIYADKRFDKGNWVFSVQDSISSAAETEELWKKCSEKKNFTELLQFVKKDKYINYRKAMIGIVLKKLKIKSGVSVKIASDVPVGSGLGSSSSLAVAMTMAITAEFKKKLSLEKINEIAYEQEKIIHGTPSGGDNSACCFGGLLWFRRSMPLPKATEVGSVPRNEIKSLKNEIPYKLENFVLVYTGQPKKTTG